MGAPAAGLDANLVSFLRQETRQEHQALEQALDLLRPPLERAQFRHILARFYGFHAVWEPEVARFPAIAAISQPRSRLACLHDDLTALGMAEAEIAALPRCEAAKKLAATETAALGSGYVVEGSTLGGQVISRALARADWAPPGGLSYFNPYGSRTGVMWQSFKAWCDAQADRLDWNAAARGARATFATLQDFLSS